jgi:hypothetical protein
MKSKLHMYVRYKRSDKPEYDGEFHVDFVPRVGEYVYILNHGDCEVEGVFHFMSKETQTVRLFVRRIDEKSKNKWLVTP